MPVLSVLEKLFSSLSFTQLSRWHPDGTLAILGSGIHVGGSGGLRFVFRRATGQG